MKSEKLKVERGKWKVGLRRNFLRVFFIALALSTFNFQLSTAQYYDWGPSPANVRWRTIRTPDVKLIYPADFEASALRTLWYLDTVRTHIDYGFRHGTMRTPVVIHTKQRAKL